MFKSLNRQQYIIFFGTVFLGIILVTGTTFSLRNEVESSSWFTLDTTFHLIGGVFAGWCAFLFTRNCWKILFIAILIGLLWELAEYVSSVYGPAYWPVVFRYYHSGGLIDTMDDLVADVLGIGLFIVVCFKYLISKSRGQRINKLY